MKTIVKTIEKDGEPENEVLAIGYQDEMLIGFLSGTECESASEILGEVTAYIELKDLEQIFFATKQPKKAITPPTFSTL